MRITFLVAPGIGNLERKNLKNHWKLAQKQADYQVVTNYEVQVLVVDYEPKKEILLMMAPGVPADELINLRKRVDNIVSKRKSPVVAVNYELAVDTVPR